MAEAVEQPEPTGEQSAETLPEKPQEAFPGENAVDPPSHEPTKVAAEEPTAPPGNPASPVKANVRSRRSGTAGSSNPPKGKPGKGSASDAKPDAKLAGEAIPQKPGDWKPRDWGLIFTLVMSIANLAILIPTWKAANAERDQVVLAIKEAREAKAETTALHDKLDKVSDKLAGELESGRTTIGLQAPRVTAIPPPEDLTIVNQSFNCSVQDGESRLRLINSEICYELRFDIQNKGAGNRRVEVTARFSREGRSWICASQEKTVAFERSEQFSIPLVSCFDKNQERRNGDLDFSLQMESIPE